MTQSCAFHYSECNAVDAGNDTVDYTFRFIACCEAFDEGFAGT